LIDKSDVYFKLREISAGLAIINKNMDICSDPNEDDIDLSPDNLIFLQKGIAVTCNAIASKTEFLVRKSLGQ